MNATLEAPISATVRDHGLPLLRAPEALTIYTVEAFGLACKAELHRASAVVIDLGAVTTCDTLGIQVLCAAKRSACALGHPVTFVNVPTAVTRIAQAIACDGLLFSTQAKP